LNTDFLASLNFRALVGLPATILLMFLAERQPMTQEYIELNTGKSDKTVHKALKVLESYGYIAEVGRYRWALSNGARQLPLGAALPEPDPETEPENIIDAEPSDKDESYPVRSENFRPEPSSSSGYLNTDSNQVNHPPLARTDGSEKFRAGPPNPKILAALDEHGIREPARSRLERLAHVTPELVDYHCKTAQNTGLAIYRIENNWAVKTEPAESAGSGKYTEGEFGVFVEH
jgi:hypothetical protein